MPLVCAALLGLATGLVIEGEGPCPAAAAVGAALRPLIPDELGPDDRHLAFALTPWGEVRVVLSEAAGRVLAERTLKATGTCASQAHRVAVLAAAWLGELGEEPLARAARGDSPPPTSPDEDLDDDVASANSATKLWPVRPSPGPPSPTYVAFRLGMSWNPASAEGGGVALGVGHSFGDFGLEGDAFFDGQARLGRFGAEVGPTLRLRRRSPQLDGRAQVVTGLLSVNDASSSQSQFDLGGLLSLRATDDEGSPVRIFAELTAEIWPMDFSRRFTSIEVSPLELILGFGVHFGGG